MVPGSTMIWINVVPGLMIKVSGSGIHKGTGCQHPAAHHADMSLLMIQCRFEMSSPVAWGPLELEGVRFIHSCSISSLQQGG